MIVGTGLVKRDRESFDWFFPMHLKEIMECVDHLHLRLHDTSCLPFLETYGSRISWEFQSRSFGRWQEDHERNALLDWALASGAKWNTVFDADEVIEPGGGVALRDYLLGLPHKFKDGARTVGVRLNYCSHHRPGYVITETLSTTWRAFRLDDPAVKDFRFNSDQDGLHCGSVPTPYLTKRNIPNLRVVHYHATNCEEYMAERAFYQNTAEVEKHGGIDWLYRCDRFGREETAVPLEELTKDSKWRFAHLEG